MMQPGADHDELIRRFQSLRRIVLYSLGMPGLLAGALFMSSVMLHWARWVSYVCFAAFFLIAVVIPILLRCPACGRGNLSGGGNGLGFNPKSCPHCSRPLRDCR